MIGRPTGYKEEFCQQMIEFFDRSPTKEIIERHVTREGDVLEVPRIVANKLPTISGFARTIGVWRQRIYDWAEKHDELSDTIKMCKAMQEDMLVENGMAGLTEKSFTIFAAKNLLKWTDKQEVRQETEAKITIDKDDEGI